MGVFSTPYPAVLVIYVYINEQPCSISKENFTICSNGVIPYQETQVCDLHVNNIDNFLKTSGAICTLLKYDLLWWESILSDFLGKQNKMCDRYSQHCH